MVIRVVDREDAERLSEVFPEPPGTPTNRHRARLVQQERGVLTALAAWDGAEPVGYCIVRWRVSGGEATEHASALGCAELGDVFVVESARGRGIGGALVEAAEQCARERGEWALGMEVTVANPDNEAARQLYAKLGYTDTGIGEFITGYSYFLPDGTECRDEEAHRYLIKRLQPPQVGPDGQGPSLPHGYTNLTVFEGGRVVKRYLGSEAADRMRNEVEAIRRTGGRVPAPVVLNVDEVGLTVTLARVPGRHGQELIDEGRADGVLEAAGRTLRGLHSNPQAQTWIHGDYGPQNLLYDEATLDVTGVLDWEFARRGLPIEDLAWSEWIVRMHHPHAVPSLAHLFRGWGDEPSWGSRQAAMLDACDRYLARANSLGDSQAADLWSQRKKVTESWLPSGY